MSKIILFLLFFPSLLLAQINDLELESIDDLEILEMFENTPEESVISKEEEKAEETNSLTTENFPDKDIDLEAEDLLKSLAKDELPKESELNTELEESVTITNIDRNLTPKYENLIKKDQISLDEELNFSETSEDNIKIHAQIIKDFKANNAPISIDRIIYEKEKKTNSRYNDWEKSAIKVQLGDISKSNLRIGQIYKGAYLINIISNKAHYTQKTLNVRFHEKIDSGQYRYLRSKDGSLKYKTFYKNIANISKVSNLYRSPYEFKRLKKKEKKLVYDNRLTGIYKFNLHTGLNSPNYTNDLLDDPSNIAPLVRLELSYLTSQNNFFEVGLIGMYESLSGNLESGGSYSFTSYSLGLNLATPKTLGEFNFLVQPRVSLLSNLSISRNSEETYTLDMIETSLLLGLERRLNFSPYGSYNLGINYQRKWYQADSEDVILDLDSESAYDDSIALSFGFRIE